MSIESSQPDVVVVGSVNMDLVVRSSSLPQLGETVLGRDFATVPGGKGANQAVGVARLGASCAFIGRVGNDAFGERLLRNLRDNNVNVDAVQVSEGVATGVALIVVVESGENAICVASGANYAVTPDDVTAAEALLRGAKVCLLQLELPVETVVRAIELCREFGVETILDPAPAVLDPPRGLFDADIITPNVSEAEMLTNLSPSAGQSNARTVAQVLVHQGARQVVLKLGAEGALVFDKSGSEHIDAYTITPVDTTAAGDAFSAGLAVGRARGQSLAQAARQANAAGALACTKFGAQPSMPTAAEVEQLLSG